MMDDRPPSDLDILAELQSLSADDPRLLQFLTPVTAFQYLPLYALVRQYVPRGGHTLDWGVGNGHFSYFLQRAGYRVSGFDMEPCPALCARFTPGSYDFRTGDPAHPSRLPFADKSFSAVISVGVLEHVRETGGTERASLREVARVLQPGGVFVCFHLPNRDSWIEAMLRRLGRWGHPYRYSRDEIERMSEETGFAIRVIKRYAALPRNILSGRRMRWLTTSSAFGRLYGLADDTLARVFSPFCQNFLYVAEKVREPIVENAETLT